MSETGPPYPNPNPVPASNSVGQFQIGVSPIGTITAFNPWSTVISQYANSPILTKLITNLAQYIDMTQNFDNFYDYIFNIDTAQGRGLDIWGRILNVARVLQVPVGSSFGFEEASGAGIDTFGAAAFYNGAVLTANFSLTDPAYRTLLFAKALFNITDSSIPAINQILLNLFPNRGNCYVVEGYPFQGFFFGFKEQLDTQPFGQAPFYSAQAEPAMAMTYVFDFNLTAVEFAIIKQSGAIPKPTGVETFVLQNA